MPTAGWWEVLWPDPAGVLARIGLKPGMEVIDLCSGDGWFTLQIAKVARHVAAIDIDPTLLEVAQVRLKESGLSNCSFIAGDAYDLARLWLQPVDLVFMANAFHGVPDPARLAMAVKAVLKPGGRFAIINWHAHPREGTTITPPAYQPGPRGRAARNTARKNVGQQRWPQVLRMVPILIPSPALGRLSRFRPDSHTES